MTIYLAILDGNIIGKINLQFDEYQAGIYGFAVHPEYRRLGYGRQILKTIIEIAKLNKSEKIILQVATENENALNLYKSCGFELASIMDYFN